MLSSFLGRILKIQPGEGGRVIAFFTLAVLMQAGVAIGITVSDAFFLSKAGADKLPILFIMMPAVMLVFIPFYNYLINRVGINAVFFITLFVLIAGGLAAFIVLSFNAEIGNWFYYLLKLYAYLWMVAIYTLYWNFVDEFFDITDAKRLFPFFSGGLATGAALGGMLVSSISQLFSVAVLFVIWSGLAFAAVPLLMFLLKRIKKIPAEENLERQGIVNLTKVVFDALGRSRYILLLNLVMFSILFLTTLTEFQYLQIFSESRSEEQMAELFGKLFLYVNIFNLLVNFFLFNRLVVRLGVRNLTLIQPLMYLAAMVFFMLDSSFEAAIFGFFVYQGIMISIDANNWNFLFNAVRSDIKVSVRTFVEGLTDPMATASAGLFLLFAGAEMGGPELAGWGVLAAVVLLLLALLLRAGYTTAMVSVLKRGWLNFAAGMRHLFNNEKLQLAEHALEHEDFKETFIKRIEIFWIISEEKTARIFLNILKTVTIEEYYKLRPAFQYILKHASHDVFREVLKWYEKSQLTDRVELIEDMATYGLIPPKKVQSLALSEKPAEKSAAALALWNSWDITTFNLALGIITEMLEQDDEQKIRALMVIEKTGLNRLVHYIAKYLNDPDYRVRSQALSAITALADKSARRITSDILPFLDYNDAAARNLAIEFLQKTADVDSVFLLLNKSENLAPRERRKVEKVIIDLGLQAVPAVLSVFNSTAYSYRARALAARVLSQLAFPQFEQAYSDIIDKELNNALRVLQNRKTLEAYLSQDETSPVKLAAIFYADTVSIITDFILEVLTIAGRLPDFELIRSSLYSTNMKSRGNALETLEQGISRKNFNRLKPLLEIGNMNTVEAVSKSDIKELLIASIESDNELEALVVAYSLYGLDKAAVEQRVPMLMLHKQHAMLTDYLYNLMNVSGDDLQLLFPDILMKLKSAPAFEQATVFELQRLIQHARTQSTRQQEQLKEGETEIGLSKNSNRVSINGYLKRFYEESSSEESNAQLFMYFDSHTFFSNLHAFPQAAVRTLKEVVK